MTDKNNVIYSIPTIALTPTATQIGMAAALAKAQTEGFQVTICIADAGGVPLQTQRTQHAFPASHEIACGKAKTAALFHKKTGALENSANKGRSALLSAPYVLMQGGVPIVCQGGGVCGAVGVSGVLPDQDEVVAQAAVEAIQEVLVDMPVKRPRL